jgi:hypothetical protein
VRGSLALGEFIPETSDVDALAVTERPTSEAEFAALVTAHGRLATLSNPYARRFEVAYIDRAALWRFQPGLRHPSLGQGETLAWAEHRENWVVERWVVREHGITLTGPDPRALIGPISAEELRAAVRARLLDWGAWAAAPDNPEWLPVRSHQAYAVETMCRGLCTLATGELPSKARGIAWALAALPEPWHATVERAAAGRADTGLDPAAVAEVLRFVTWAATGDEH